MEHRADMKKNIVFIGLPGCGKTSIGKAVAEKLSIPFYDTDEYIEKTEGIHIKEIFLQGEEYFRKLESQAIREISEKSPSVISTGGGVVKVSNNMEIMRENSIIIFINRPIENIITDVDISTRPLLAEGTEKLFSLYDERYPLYKKYSDIEVKNNQGFQEVVDKIIKLIEDL